jgi:hypothetical protein
VITTFLHAGCYALVTGARFQPGPPRPMPAGRRTTRVLSNGTFAFDLCWTGQGWSARIGDAVTYATRAQAIKYLDQHQAQMGALLVHEDGVQQP